MRIEILHVPECPNLEVARTRVHEALRDAGADAVVEEVVVSTPDEARQRNMHGSPTILVDGNDPFASGDEASLACRLYLGEAGTSGSPSAAELAAVFAR